MVNIQLYQKPIVLKANPLHRSLDYALNVKRENIGQEIAYPNWIKMGSLKTPTGAVLISVN